MTGDSRGAPSVRQLVRASLRLSRPHSHDYFISCHKESLPSPVSRPGIWSLFPSSLSFLFISPIFKITQSSSFLFSKRLYSLRHFLNFLFIPLFVKCSFLPVYRWVCVLLSLSQSAVSPLSVHPSVRPVSGWSLLLPPGLLGHTLLGPELRQVLWVRCLRTSHATFLLLLNLCQNVSDLPLGQLKIRRHYLIYSHTITFGHFVAVKLHTAIQLLVLRAYYHSFTIIMCIEPLALLTGYFIN